MNEIAISVGETICQAGFGLAGLGQARCYDHATMQSVGYALVALLLVFIVWMRAWSRNG